jgi:hypothetical protein
MPSASAVASSGVAASSRSASVVVEDHGLHGRVTRHGLELPEAGRVHRLDDDQARDRVELEPAGLGKAELVGVQADEIADVLVQRAVQRRHGARIEAPRC